MTSQFLRLSAIAARNLLVGGNVSSLSLLAKPRQMVAYANESMFFFRTFTRRRGLPERTVFDVFPQARFTDISLLNRENDETWLHTVTSFTADIVSLCMLCRAIQPKVVFEIGTLIGYTTAHLALNSPEGCEVHTLDLPPGTEPVLRTGGTDRIHIGLNKERKRYVWEGTAAEKKIQAHFGDSGTFDYSPYYGRVDLFFIDGAHSYDYVRSDTLNALKCCQPGSVIAWHDFGRGPINGVSKWLVEFSKLHRVYAVPGSSVAFCVVRPA